MGNGSNWCGKNILALPEDVFFKDSISVVCTCTLFLPSICPVFVLLVDSVWQSDEVQLFQWSLENKG